MGTIHAAVLIDAVLLTLQDPSSIRWARNELLGFLNDGQSQIVMAKPDANIVTVSTQLTAGSRQQLPPGGISFRRLPRNMGVSPGTTPGRAPRYIPMRTLDMQIPDWNSTTPSTSVIHYATDDQDPRTFYVYPPQPASNQGFVDLEYSVTPAEVTSESNPITLHDIYKTALMKYMEYRCYIKDADYANDGAAGDIAYRAFVTLVTVKDSADEKQKGNF